MFGLGLSWLKAIQFKKGPEARVHDVVIGSAIKGICVSPGLSGKIIRFLDLEGGGLCLESVPLVSYTIRFP